jgi:hypothetical protein
MGVTLDEELTVLDTQLRRLKIEYDVYFSNPKKRPPTEIEWKVQALLRKFSDGGRMSFSQRYRYNEMAQRYAVHSDLWRKKCRIREEGYRRPQDALLGVQGVRPEDREAEKEHVGVHEINEADVAAQAPAADQPFSIACSDGEPDKVKKLYDALMEAKQRAGETAGASTLDSFASFVKNKTSQIRQSHHCAEVEYTVELEGGKVKLKAKAKT